MKGAHSKPYHAMLVTDQCGHETAQFEVIADQSSANQRPDRLLDGLSAIVVFKEANKVVFPLPAASSCSAVDCHKLACVSLVNAPPDHNIQPVVVTKR